MAVQNAAKHQYFTIHRLMNRTQSPFELVAKFLSVDDFPQVSCRPTKSPKIIFLQEKAH